MFETEITWPALFELINIRLGDELITAGRWVGLPRVSFLVLASLFLFCGYKVVNMLFLISENRMRNSIYVWKYTHHVRTDLKLADNYKSLIIFLLSDYLNLKSLRFLKI